VTPCFLESKPFFPILFIEMADSTVKDSIVASVIEKFRSRSEVGIAKYGTTLDRTDLGILDWIQHAQEELMDGILYLEKLKKTLFFK
jgi:hypothetical protein